jgi:DNA-binding MarR family transcriptional regulator
MSSIEKYLQIKKFHSEAEKTMYSLLYSANLTQDYLENFFKQYGLTAAQFNVLRVIKNNAPDPVTINMIKERMLHQNSDASRIVQRLSEAGYIKRLVSKADKRAVDVVLSKQGADVLNKVEKKYEQALAPINDIKKSDMKELARILDKLMEGFH